ncbi:hypothetical protein Poli38472_002869 [Pythium oligandrum]|uniref:Protein kinase domain-containing protein n=1 Tax=Pythium oligandrum TaxID=41045 RepID=A0A8K1C5Q4_PYTOL|nr:hypothetical protein Poli38472_002869 [Pythium oligandrum]|eukprot:TMW56944.1 hypothetical protein Poli38472_002869 [Pythium oligandrum]
MENSGDGPNNASPVMANASLPLAAETTMTAPAVKPEVRPPLKLVASESARSMTGIKPIVPLRKRGKSFRETTKINLSVDAQGARHLNQYTFHEELGRGAYGLVLRVQSNETSEFFAAKIVNKKALKKVRVGRFGNALQSVKKELAIWQKFKHRHVVVLREIIDTDDSDELYMISEIIEGGPVLDGETDCTPLNPEETKLYFCQLIEGIDFLHENKVIHRDIKPGNLLLKKAVDGEMILKIADFGVSHEMDSEDDSLRQTAGTAIFMAPEMLTGEKFHGKPVDIWACGVTLYMFVYGHPPFVAKTLTELYGKIQHDPIEYPTSVGEKEVESGLIDLMQHILEKDPNLRFTSKQIRAHPWAWRDFQVTAMKCVTQPDGRRSSFPVLPMSLSGVASVGKSLRQMFGRKSVFPTSGSGSMQATVEQPDERAATINPQ